MKPFNPEACHFDVGVDGRRCGRTRNTVVHGIRTIGHGHRIKMCPEHDALLKDPVALAAYRAAALKQFEDVKARRKAGWAKVQSNIAKAVQKAGA